MALNNIILGTHLGSYRTWSRNTRSCLYAFIHLQSRTQDTQSSQDLSMESVYLIHKSNMVNGSLLVIFMFCPGILMCLTLNHALHDCSCSIGCWPSSNNSLYCFNNLQKYFQNNFNEINFILFSSLSFNGAYTLEG